MRVAAGLALAAFSMFVAAAPARAADPAACKAPRFADIGWTDITATTAVAARVLTSLGYTPKIQVLSVPVTYMSMKNKDIDIFLAIGCRPWKATATPSSRTNRWKSSASISNGAKYTMAVPAYTYADGLKSVADIAKFKDQLGGKIYGLEPGNDGDRIVLGMIKGDKDGLAGFDLSNPASRACWPSSTGRSGASSRSCSSAGNRIP
ncbi:MAG: glycine betaine ABC transporter substrate-binding protein [Aliidongia sp.]